ncbi:hypothetical protein [Neolewinella sp.]|uniref:hypothetical protein n=1 Tax=Neolewinella sp. TaxID=2993543 RepID=UPI003B518DF3
MRYYLSLLLVLFAGFAIAQDTYAGRWSVVVAAPVKFNLGQATSTQIISPTPGTMVLDVPDRLRLRQPHFGLETIIYYGLRPRLRVGIGAGLSGSFGERDLMFGSYTRLLVPVFAAVALDIPVSGSIDLTVSGRGGHQWHEQQFGNGSSSVVLFQQGGKFLGLGLTVASKRYASRPQITLGYEYHQFRYSYLFPQPTPGAGDFVPIVLGPVMTRPRRQMLTLSLGLRL